MWFSGKKNIGGYVYCILGGVSNRRDEFISVEKESHEGFRKQLVKKLKGAPEQPHPTPYINEQVPTSIKAADNVTLKSTQERKTDKLCLISRKPVRAARNVRRGN